MKIPTVKIEFHNLPYLVMSKEQYDQLGSYKGFLKMYEMPIFEIKKVHHILLDTKDYPSEVWEG